MKRRKKLYVAESGKGQPVILLHGMMSSHRYWKDVERYVAGERLLLMPDLLGFGKSPKPRRVRYDMDLYIHSLEETFANYEFTQKPVLVGHSMGAIVAIYWAAMYPDQFSRLVLSAPMLGNKDNFWQLMASVMLQRTKLTGRRRARLMSLTMGFSGLLPTRIAAAMVKKWPKHVTEDATRHKFRVYNNIMRHKLYMDEILATLESVDLPVEIVLGQNDPTGIHAYERLDTMFAQDSKRNVMVVGTAHQIPLESPKTIAKLILSV